MAKASGGTRLVRPYFGSLEKNMAEYDAYINTGLYSREKSSPPTEKRAYILYSADRDYDADEMHVANVLADNGFNVKLTSEKDVMFATYIDKKGNPHYSDGTVSLYTYEQKTSTRIDTTAAASVKQAVMHANSKHSDVALIYDKSGLFHREDIENGISKYKSEHRVWKKAGVKTVIVVNKNDEIYEHLIV